eukprot:3410437-Rhodomonas_salina.1
MQVESALKREQQKRLAPYALSLSVVCGGTVRVYGGTELACGGTELAYGGTDLAHGGTELAYDGTDLAYGGTELAYGGTDLAYDGTSDELTQQLQHKEVLPAHPSPPACTPLPSCLHTPPFLHAHPSPPICTPPRLLLLHAHPSSLRVLPACYPKYDYQIAAGLLPLLLHKE